MPIRFLITTDKPYDVTTRGWREILKAAWQAVGACWLDKFRPQHFEESARQRYGYQPRSAKYQARKEKTARYSWRVKDGGKRDLVLSGRSRTALMRPQVPVPFPTRVTITMPTVPDERGREYFAMRPRAPGRPNLGEEMTRVTPEELAELERVWLETFERLLQEYREKHPNPWAGLATPRSW